MDNKAPQIHFVDIVPSLMNELEGKLTRYFPQDNNWWAVWQPESVDGLFA